MSKPNLKITASDQRTPERAALADAIERRAEAAAQLARLEKALEQSEGGMYGEGGALRSVDCAETQLAEAKANEGHHLAAVATGEASDDANPVKLAELALSEAQARLDRARKTVAALVGEITEAAKERDHSKKAVDDAVREVFASEAAVTITTTLREAAALQEQLGAKRLVLKFLKDACFASWPPSDATKPIEQFLNASPYPHEGAGSKAHPALEPWRVAKESLDADADAALPV